MAVGHTVIFSTAIDACSVSALVMNVCNSTSDGCSGGIADELTRPMKCCVVDRLWATGKSRNVCSRSKHPMAAADCGKTVRSFDAGVVTRVSRARDVNA